jgi:DNA-binding NarL/FixJ family response regulator
MKAKVIVVEGSLAEVLAALKEFEKSRDIEPEEPPGDHAEISETTKDSKARLVVNGHRYPELTMLSISGRRERLSARERVILLHLSAGSTDKTIARDLQIAEATVRTHVRNISNKIGVENRTKIAAWARQQGIL